MNKEFTQSPGELDRLIGAINTVPHHDPEFFKRVNDLYEWIHLNEDNEYLYLNAAVPLQIRQQVEEYSQFEISRNSDREAMERKIAAPRISYRRYVWMAAASVILLTVGAGYLFRNYKADGQPATNIVHAAKGIEPGSNKATLRLSDGKIINLTDAGEGLVAEQTGISVNKNKDGQLVYTVKDRQLNSHCDQAAETNVISTPRGGQYQIVLPDGSKVWLNAESSISFPTSFTGAKRAVSLTGEAYLEVAQMPRSPFIVEAGVTVVQVLGTSFNINAYTDEDAVKTTLLEGLVRVSRNPQTLPGAAASASDVMVQHADEVVLKPGMQAIAAIHSGIKMMSVDTEKEMAWRNGLFSFKKADIKTIMRQLARWYNLDVKYSGAPITDKFYFEIRRSSPIAEVLASLEAIGGVHFNVSGNKVTVSR